MVGFKLGQKIELKRHLPLYSLEKEERTIFIKVILGNSLIFIGFLARVIAPIMEFLHGTSFWDAEINFQTGQRILKTGQFYDHKNIWQSPYPPLPLLIFALFVLLSGYNLLLFVFYFRVIEIGSTLICYLIICHYLDDRLKRRITWGVYLTSFPALWLVRENRPISYLFLFLILIGVYFIAVRSQIRIGLIFIAVTTGIKWFSFPVLMLLPFWNQWQRRSMQTKVEDILIIIGIVSLLLIAPTAVFPHYLMIYEDHISKSVLSDDLTLLIRITSFFLIFSVGLMMLIREKEVDIIELLILGLAVSIIPISITGPGRQYLRLLLMLFPIAYPVLSQRWEILVCPYFHRERSIFHQEACEVAKFSDTWKNLNLMANLVYLMIGVVILAIFVISQHQKEKQKNYLSIGLLGLLFIFLTIISDSTLLNVLELIEQ